MRLGKTVCAAVFAVGLGVVSAPAFSTSSYHSGGADCERLQINAKAEHPLAPSTVQRKESCTTRISHGFLIPEPACTPGAIDPTGTLIVLRNASFKTPCVRIPKTEFEKAKTYRWYGITLPPTQAWQTGRVRA